MKTTITKSDIAKVLAKLGLQESDILVWKVFDTKNWNQFYGAILKGYLINPVEWWNILSLNIKYFPKNDKHNWKLSMTVNEKVDNIEDLETEENKFKFSYTVKSIDEFNALRAMLRKDERIDFEI